MNRDRTSALSDFAEHHLFQRLDKTILFNVETLRAYEASPAISHLVSALNAGGCEKGPLVCGRHSPDEIGQAARELERTGFLRGSRPTGVRLPPLKRRRGLRHLELMVTHDCNLRCRYCFGCPSHEQFPQARYLYGSNSKGMSSVTARRGVDLLIAQSGAARELSVIFFGGEPLLAFPLIREMTAYIREKEAETGKRIDLSLSTNGLLLTRGIVDFLQANRMGCQISIDGPDWIHDYARCYGSGRGSHERVVERVRLLMQARPGRVPARATISHGRVNLPEAFEHLLKLGFGSVHIEPALGSCGPLTVTAEDVPAIKAQQEQIAAFFLQSLLENRFHHYSNLVRFVRQTYRVEERLAYYCGAARTYLCLAQEGVFYPCHRFAGMPEYRMGNLDQGIDWSLQEKILSLDVDHRLGCRDCWARYLCGGGCWKHAVDRHGALDEPDQEVSCELIRHQIECALAINAALNFAPDQASRPEAGRYGAPRVRVPKAAYEN